MEEITATLKKLDLKKEIKTEQTGKPKSIRQNTLQSNLASYLKNFEDKLVIITDEYLPQLLKNREELTDEQFLKLVFAKLGKLNGKISGLEDSKYKSLTVSPEDFNKAFEIWLDIVMEDTKKIVIEQEENKKDNSNQDLINLLKEKDNKIKQLEDDKRDFENKKDELDNISTSLLENSKEKDGIIENLQIENEKLKEELEKQNRRIAIISETLGLNNNYDEEIRKTI